MHLHFFFALSVLAAGVVTGNPILERATCKQDNCIRGIMQTSTAYKPALSTRLADCSNFMTTTVTPDASTITITNTATATSITTLNGALNRRSAATNFSQKPIYATWCVDTIAYSSGCSCAGITAATITAPAPSITVTTTATAAYTSTATPSATGFYLQAHSAEYPAVDGQCGFFNPALANALTFVGSSSQPISPTLFTLDSNGYLYSKGLQTMSFVSSCHDQNQCSLEFPRGYTPAQITSDYVPLVCSQQGLGLSCSYTIKLSGGGTSTLSYSGLQGPESQPITGMYASFFASFAGQSTVSYTVVTDINQCSTLPTSPAVTTVTPSSVLPTPFYLQVFASNNAVNGQCGFLQDYPSQSHVNSLSFLGTGGVNCGRPIPKFILDSNGHLTTTDLYQLGTYISCGSGLSNCGLRYVGAISTSDILYYGPNYYPLICSYDANASLLNCAYSSSAGNFKYLAYGDSSQPYQIFYGQDTGTTSLTFRVIQDLGSCAASC